MNKGFKCLDESINIAPISFFSLQKAHLHLCLIFISACCIVVFFLKYRRQVEKIYDHNNKLIKDYWFRYHEDKKDKEVCR